ncbi:MAG: hypothetical protein PXX82_05525, partial [Methanomassiliicoccales archaeon]|nr:hypothetical protein [Methanomassiliicoccales archaeon]
FKFKFDRIVVAQVNLDFTVAGNGGNSEIKINLGNNYPVKLEFEIAGGSGRVKYLLAPRVES